MNMAKRYREEASYYFDKNEQLKMMLRELSKDRRPCDYNDDSCDEWCDGEYGGAMAGGWSDERDVEDGERMGRLSLWGGETSSEEKGFSYEKRDAANAFRYDARRSCRAFKRTSPYHNGLLHSTSLPGNSASLGSSADAVFICPWAVAIAPDQPSFGFGRLRVPSEGCMQPIVHLRSARERFENEQPATASVRSESGRLRKRRNCWRQER